MVSESMMFDSGSKIILKEREELEPRYSYRELEWLVRIECYALEICLIRREVT
jgi:hypothetical protein